MLKLLPLLLRLAVELVLLPVRLLAGLIAGTAMIFGTIAWPIQMLAPGRTAPPLPAALMWLLSVAAVPAGLRWSFSFTSAATADQETTPRSLPSAPTRPIATPHHEAAASRASF
jgi:hypothetical protein